MIGVRIAMPTESVEMARAFLAAVRSDIAVRIWAQALRNGGRVIEKAVTANAPRGRQAIRRGRQGKKYPRLASSIKTHTRKRGLQPVISVESHAYWSKFVEYGTKAYKAGDVRMVELRGRKGTTRKRERVRRSHAATKAQPFMRPAADTHRTAAVNEVLRTVRYLSQRWQTRLANRAKVGQAGSFKSTGPLSWTGGGSKSAGAAGGAGGVGGGVQGRDSRGRFTGNS